MAREVFEGQRQGEEILLIFRRHFLSNRRGLLAFLIILITFSSPYLIWSDNLKLLMVAAGGFVFGLLVIFYHIILWRFNYVLITNQRIRQISQKNFFKKNVIDLRLSKIHSISYSVPGFLAEIFHFGTILIKTMVGDLIINNVNRPEKVYNILQDAINNLDSKVENEKIV